MKMPGLIRFSSQLKKLTAKWQAIGQTYSSKVFFYVNGEEHCNEEAALAELLADEVLFSNAYDYYFGGEYRGKTVVLFVLCNDVFAWACADAEDLPYDQIGILYKMHQADKKWGTDKWCCRQRKQKPQPPIVKAMKADGVWDVEMEALPDNTQDAETQAVFASIKNKP